MSFPNAVSMIRVTAHALAAVVFAATARPATAQTAPEGPTEPPHWEFVVSSGRMIQIGAPRNAEDGNMTAAQVWYMLNPKVAVTGTAGWARSRDLGEAAGPKRDIFTYDLGAELRAPRTAVHKATSVMPFAGLGVGGRTDNLRGVARAAAHNVSVYGSAGLDVGVRRVGLRIEVRDYVTGFRASDTGMADARNAVAILAGLRLGGR